MTYPCGIIRDLLPLYIDEVAGGESKKAVEEHLAACEECRVYLESMKSENRFTVMGDVSEEEEQMTKSLKKVKKRMNRKMRNVMLSALAAVAVIVLGFQVLFHMPLKSIDVKEIFVSATVYPIDELPREISIEDESVKISSGEGDAGELYRVTIPAMPNAKVNLSEEAMAKNEYVTVISWYCPYAVEEMIWNIRPDEGGDTLYVESFRTTLFNNKAPEHRRTSQTLEMRKINKIVFAGEGGEEAVIWEDRGK